jgi:hypothetical protein
MTKVSISAEFRSQSSLQFPFPDGQHFNHDAFLRRMERLNARRENSRTGAAKLGPQYSEGKLLREGKALETAWHFEVASLMVMKRLNTAEADAIAKAARAATAAIVRRIERARAMTPDGLKVKLRAILWRRDGEPFETEGFEDATFDDQQIEM